MQPTFFATPREFRTWLTRHHANATELLIGFYNKASGKTGLTYAEALDEALCFGWIDGVRKRRDASSYTIRFTPRKSGSIWSLVNVRHVARLTAAGRMQTAGSAAFERRVAKKTGVYSFENRPRKLPAEFEQRLRANRRAWKFWHEQPTG